MTPCHVDQRFKIGSLAEILTGNPALRMSLVESGFNEWIGHRAEAGSWQS